MNTKSLTWELQSYVPGMKAHALYEGTRSWIERVDDWLDDVGLEDYERLSSVKLPRSPIAVEFVIEATLALIQSVRAMQRGLSEEESRAILLEHLPSPPLLS